MDTIWYRVNLGDAMLATPALERLESLLRHIHLQAEHPEDLLAVYRHESADLHCDLVIYLNAAFQELANLPDSRLRNGPVVSDCAFLAGNEGRLRQLKGQ